MRNVALIVVLFFSLIGTGCGLLPKERDETLAWSVSRLYSEARSALNDGSFETAIRHYERLQARFPYGHYAQQAQIDIAYAYWKSQDPVSALAACDRFIRLHPNHPHVDYVYYLRGLINFKEDPGYFGWISRQDMTERDPRGARESFNAFRELVTRFPDSKYTPDAIMRMQYLVNSLALLEVHVARYYIKRGAYVAAVNRAQYALVNYPEAPAIEEALSIMVTAYDLMGMDDLRDGAERVMRKNFPDSAHLTRGPGQKRRWWRLW